MNEHPILFSTEMVKAILDGRKSQTRRVIKLPKDCTRVQQDYLLSFNRNTFNISPYGQVGDRLWVRETHYRFGYWAKNGFTKTGKQKWTFKADSNEVYYMDSPPLEDAQKPHERNVRGLFKRPSIFMPRWASRITLEITEIRVQRLQSITKIDANAEGFFSLSMMQWETMMFQRYWDIINGKKYPWESNPWLWAISFKRIK